MIPWEHLDTARIPGSRDDLRLMRRGAEYSIMLGQITLMGSRLSGSEKALATLVCERLTQVKKPRVLIGGLGMGFTLRAALEGFGEAEIVVSELFPAVVQWARGPMAELFAGCLDDPRVTIRTEDVGEIIRSSRSIFDAILLDVDNGPDALTHIVNQRLYSHQGVSAARNALRPGGILAVWSQGPDDRFAARLQQAHFTVEEVRVRAQRKGKGSRHVIWLARKA
jgi:spermidine synthase